VALGLAKDKQRQAEYQAQGGGRDGRLIGALEEERRHVVALSEKLSGRSTEVERGVDARRLLERELVEVRGMLAEEQERVEAERGKVEKERERVRLLELGTPGAVETLEMMRRLTEERDADRQENIELEARCVEVEGLYGSLQKRSRLLIETQH
jgi:hypothetical protein